MMSEWPEAEIVGRAELRDTLGIKRWAMRKLIWEVHADVTARARGKGEQSGEDLGFRSKLSASRKALKGIGVC